MYMYIYIFEEREDATYRSSLFFFPQPTFNKLTINGEPLNNGNIKYEALLREKFDGHNDRPRGQISKAKNMWRWLYFP